MKPLIIPKIIASLGCVALAGCASSNIDTSDPDGYIGCSLTPPPTNFESGAGIGFYTAIWPAIDQPLDDCAVGLVGTWITPDESDDQDKPLAPKGTTSREWPSGPTWDGYFETIEGSPACMPGAIHFSPASPKFCMCAIPQCYDYSVGSPGWAHRATDETLPDDRLAMVQFSNRLLIPPDGLPFQGHPDGQFLGYSWMALPFTDATAGDPPTGDQSWTCFLNTANFKGPIAYYIPETWSKIGKLFHYPYVYGRGLDARPGDVNSLAMEINSLPCIEAEDAHGIVYSKVPKLQFPVDSFGRTLLLQDVTLYSKAALYNELKTWRNGGPACTGQFNEQGAWKATLTTNATSYNQDGANVTGIERVFGTEVFKNNAWGLKWSTNEISPQGVFPQYFKQIGKERVAIAATDVPPETQLLTTNFDLADPKPPYTSPTTGAWSNPGPKIGPFTANLADGSVVTYYWYRFVDQPSFQQYNWSEEKKAKLQALVEKIHASWPVDRNYMPPPSQGALVSLDPGLIVTPPKGFETGYVPIVTHQEASLIQP